MAQANLTVTDELAKALADVAANVDSRSLEVVVDTEALELRAGAMTTCTGSQQEDYGAAVATAWDDSRCSLFLFRLSEEKFTTVLFAPDTAPVRSRMLFASTVQQARNAFGTDRLEGGFHAADPEEASQEAFAEWLLRSHGSLSAMSETEKIREMIAEQTAVATAEASASASSASSSGLVSFEPSETLVPSLRSFAGGGGGAISIRLHTEDEVLNVIDTVTESAATVDGASAVLSLVSTESPGFVVLSRGAFVAVALAGGAPGGEMPTPTKGKPAGCALVYYCPPGAHIREKMMQSTAKATVIDIAKGAGIEFADLLEVEDTKELTEDAARNIAAERAAEAAASSVTLATGASASAVVGFSKPARPGRRKRK
jgi:hypothetical protein